MNMIAMITTAAWAIAATTALNLVHQGKLAQVAFVLIAKNMKLHRISARKNATAATWYVFPRQLL
jgi:hypothetical protein